VALGWPNAPLTAAAVAAPNADGATTFFDFSGQGTREMTGVRYILFSLKKKMGKLHLRSPRISRFI
jgi:hypothetical protein